MSAGKVQAVKAWAVVCASLKIHDYRTSESVADAYARLYDDRDWYPCGPHKVVLLRGSVRKGR